jgi:hypothetical protein
MKFTDLHLKLTWKQLILMRLGFLYIGILGSLFPTKVALQIYEWFRVNKNDELYLKFMAICDYLSSQDKN